MSNGYELVMITPFEVALYHRGDYVRQWWIGTFGSRMPELDHPEVVLAIEINEKTT
jgi:hypothetical protein